MSTEGRCIVVKWNKSTTGHRMSSALKTNPLNYPEVKEGLGNLGRKIYGDADVFMKIRKPSHSLLPKRVFVKTIQVLEEVEANKATMEKTTPNRFRGKIVV